ncbi:MAG: GTP-binding protein [Candidatus Omnitrophota bacterium]|jgi:sulfate adenylyltransferase subunit 1 (EFTu-like GTPase family)
MNKYLRIAVTGDVDSGKSTLIGRVLSELSPVSAHMMDEVSQACKRLGRDFEFAYLLDSLEEERQEQRTIDTTQVFCKARNGLEIVFIDVPGHRELIKNMLSGTSLADGAILVVDAGKPIAEQARRHAFILAFLGIRHVMVALNKMDAIGFQEQEFERIKAGIQASLKPIGIDPEFFVPISAKEGENLLKPSKRMKWYTGDTLIDALSSVRFRKKPHAARPALESKEFVFLVQDIYQLKKKKIAVGLLVLGSIGLKSSCCVLPLNTKNRVEEILELGRSRKSVRSPEGPGLVLRDMSCLKRGDIVCVSKNLNVTFEFSAKVFCVKQLRKNKSINLKCGPQETVAHVSRITHAWETSGLREINIDQGVVEENNIAEVRVSVEQRIVFAERSFTGSLGRFVLRDHQGDIEAIGIIQ